MKIFRAPDNYPHWAEVADLIHNTFAYMTPILGHPARAMEVTAGQLKNAAKLGAVFLVEDDQQPVASLFTRKSRDITSALYIGWLAVDHAHRGLGLANSLVSTAENEARNRDLSALTLDTGTQMIKLHSLFENMGFRLHSHNNGISRFVKPVGEGKCVSLV